MSGRSYYGGNVGRDRCQSLWRVERLAKQLHCKGRRGGNQAVGLDLPQRSFILVPRAVGDSNVSCSVRAQLTTPSHDSFTAVHNNSLSAYRDELVTVDRILCLEEAEHPPSASTTRSTLAL